MTADDAEIAALMTAFEDKIYPTDRRFFGSEWTPGVDNDPHVHIVYARNLGASTGGFTDCLLQHGAIRVYAMDVGYGILEWKIRNSKRVIVMEKTNARYVQELPEKLDLATIDASFISSATAPRVDNEPQAARSGGP